jgi:hypothetical protein
VSQENAKGWKPKAYAAISKFYKVLEERATFEERLDEARAACVRAGVEFSSYRDNSPTVTTDDAVVCPCGSIVPLDYEARRLPRGPDGVLHCAACREKTQQVQRDDAASAAVATTEKPSTLAPPSPVAPVGPRHEDVPF